MKKQIPLDEFKKGKRNVNVEWINNTVSWNNKSYKLTFVNVGGKNYPYVILSDIKSLSELADKIKKVNKEKYFIKHSEYEILNNKYLIIGIGKIAIKVKKNGKEEAEFIKYTSTEGQYLLNKMILDLQLL